MNILSIDFDWIMQPTIEAYNNMCHAYHDLGPSNLWENIFTLIPNFNPECDLDRFTKLYFLLKNLKETINSDNVLIGLNHDGLYQCMKDLNEKKYIVYNIDHHHDLGYNSDKCKIEDQNVSVGNWAAKAHYDLNMVKYVWIHNPNSNFPEQIPDRLKYVHTTDLSILEKVKFDKIFISASWEWVPLKYQNLFNILTSIFDD